MTEVRRNIPSFSTVTSSFKTYIISLPLLTTIITCISILFYVLNALFSDVIYDALSLSPEKFFDEGQVWRLVTYPYPPYSLGNILFNLIAFLPLSTAIEHTIGTLEYFYILMTIFTILSGSLYLLCYLILSYETGIGGLSVWIFGVVVWESRELAGRERDIFGFFRIPAHFYPIVLLLLMEILFPNILFISHLCGLFAGYLYSFGYLSCIIPSSVYFSNLESKFSRLSNFRGFVKAEEGSRGGWWLPLWNQDVDGLEDPLELPLHSNNGDATSVGGEGENNGHDNNVVSGGGGSGKEGGGSDGDDTLINTTSTPTQNVRSSSPEISTPVFVVPSSNESSRVNSPQLPDITDDKGSEDPPTTQINNDVDSLIHHDTSPKDVKLVSDD